MSTPPPSDTAARAAGIVRARRPDAYRVAIILGSGLGGFADAVEDAVRIPYGELPGFPAAGVSGHAGALVCGRIGGLPVLVLAGRAHFYEHGDAAVMRPALEAVAALGIDTLILTNAAGSVRQKMPPGSLMAIADHINVNCLNPLIGEPSDRRFVNMVDAYDLALRARLATCAAPSRRPPPFGHLRLVLRPELRDAGRNPDGAVPRRRCGRHVYGAGSDPRPLPRVAGGGDFDHHQPRWPAWRRTARATARPRRSPARRRASCRRFSPASSADLAGDVP